MRGLTSEELEILSRNLALGGEAHVEETGAAWAAAAPTIEGLVAAGRFRHLIITAAGLEAMRIHLQLAAWSDP